MIVRPLRGLACALGAVVLSCAPVKEAARPPAAAAASAPRPVPGAPPAVPAGLVFTVEPADAEVFIDGRPLGRASDLPGGGLVALPSGLYQVSLKRAGYATWRAEVAVRAAPEPIRVTLLRK